VLGFRDGGFADGQYAAIVIFGQDDGDDLMGSELIANCSPGSVHAGLQEAVLDGGQEMVSQHTKEDVRLGAVLQMAISVKAVRIRLEVAATNQKAIGLYRRFGFRIAGRLANYYADNTDGLFMILWLRGPKSRFGMCFKQKLAYNRRRPEC